VEFKKNIVLLKQTSLATGFAVQVLLSEGFLLVRTFPHQNKVNKLRT